MRFGHNYWRTHQSMNSLEVFHLHGISCPEFDKHRNTEDEIAVIRCQYGLVFRQGPHAAPACCNGPSIDEVRGWHGWWSRRLEHRGCDSNSNLINESYVCTLGAQKLIQTNHVDQKGESHTMEHRHCMCTDYGTTQVTTSMPRQAREAEPVAIRKNDWLWERD